MTRSPHGSLMCGALWGREDNNKRHRHPIGSRPSSLSGFYERRSERREGLCCDPFSAIGPGVVSSRPCSRPARAVLFRSSRPVRSRQTAALWCTWCARCTSAQHTRPFPRKMRGLSPQCIQQYMQGDRAVYRVYWCPGPRADLSTSDPAKPKKCAAAAAGFAVSEASVHKIMIKKSTVN